MNKNNAVLISNVRETHKQAIHDFLKTCTQRFLIVSPYLSKDMEAFLSDFDFSTIDKVELITTFKPKDPEQITKPFQLRDFINHFKNNYPKLKYKIHINNSLHGKIYISNYGDQMILTSANFTRKGLSENHEWGLLTKDRNVIEETLEQLYQTIDAEDLTENQIQKACMFAEKYLKDNPDWAKVPSIHSDILESVYSSQGEHNQNPQYFLKPIGHREKPITFETMKDFSGIHQKLHFSKKYPKGVKKGDIIITTAIGAGSILSYFQVISGVTPVSDLEKLENSDYERWPFFVEGRNLSQSFGEKWFEHKLQREELVKDFKQKMPNIPITSAGGFSLGSLAYGSDKLKITKEFAEFLISRIDEKTT